jgi:hypothetical protein
MTNGARTTPATGAMSRMKLKLSFSWSVALIALGGATIKSVWPSAGAKVVRHGRYVAFQMAEVAIPRQMFQQNLWLIAELRPQPPPAPA